MRVIFSGSDESVQIEVATSGHSTDKHASGSLLTLEVKEEIKKWASNDLKPNKIRLKLLVSSNFSD
jgi:hypothetical protein